MSIYLGVGCNYKKMERGIIYTIFDWIIENLKYLNLVEYFKKIAEKIYPRNTRTASRAAVDLFIILKWIVISLFWFFNIKNSFANTIVWYLIFCNLYTYFYHHSWSKKLARNEFDLDRIKRRFLNLLLSIAFNVTCFGYLFAQPFSSNFKWQNGYSTLSDSLLFSLSNSITSSYEPVTIISSVGHRISLIETIISFVFLTIILANSIPQIKEVD